MEEIKMTKTDKRRATLEAKRAKNINRYMSNPMDDGRKGRCFEIECANPLSNKADVSAQHRTDVYIKMVKNGRIVYVPAECKTNGGRIDDLMTADNKSQFVIYRLEFTQKHKASKKKPEAWEEKRVVPAVIIPTALFLNMLRECNAWKAVAHHGIQDGIAIQCSSKKMFERLSLYIKNYGGSVRFDREMVYDMKEFDGLEL